MLLCLVYFKIWAERRLSQLSSWIRSTMQRFVYKQLSPILIIFLLQSCAERSTLLNFFYNRNRLLVVLSVFVRHCYLLPHQSNKIYHVIELITRVKFFIVHPTTLKGVFMGRFLKWIGIESKLWVYLGLRVVRLGQVWPKRVDYLN